MKVELDYVRNACNTFGGGAGTKFLWLHLTVIAFAAAYIVLTLKYFFSMIDRFRHIRALHKQNSKFQKAYDVF